MKARLLASSVLAGALALSSAAFGQQSAPPGDEETRRRLAALEEGQAAILKELRELKTLLASRPAAPAAPAAAPAAPRVNTIGQPLTIAGSASRGDATAKLVLVEFSDFQCPFCGRYVKDTYSQIQREYVDTGKIRYVFRNLPLEGIHPFALGAAVAGECARAQGKFWEMHDRMFENQAALREPGLVASARALGMDGPAFEKCLKSEEPLKRVRQDLADAAKLGSNATPAFFLAVEDKDGQTRILQSIVGAKTFDSFKTSIDLLLNSPALRR